MKIKQSPGLEDENSARFFVGVDTRTHPGVGSSRFGGQSYEYFRIAQSLAVSWNTANTAILEEGKRTLIDDPHRFDGVWVIGVDEHVWRHTNKGDKYVTVIIDLTPVRN